VSDGLVLAISGLALLLAVVAFVLAALDRLPPKAHLQGLLLLQVLVLVQAVLALARLGGWDGPSGELLGYLAVAVLLVPGGMVLTVEERTRWGTAVLGAACLVLVVVVLRLQVVWDAGA
jgi:asparagine N-glycosylation enzyme membrane subunit Stt3